MPAMLYRLVDNSGHGPRPQTIRRLVLDVVRVYPARPPSRVRHARDGQRPA
eukprot:CAMPEP_0170350378 /NCGR_PEP_ID=MMETSP0116_2-20130129/76484_1 /TAXON_ID=400756 /ORGANISM="Durinskia baltica, Strain CSIRO CS-38" /LENGTH=50 /DNA_ID=CAMNT_0010604271 /DNA_START=1 /DNA_END=150 /DNA_ORIENTATION=-